MAVIVKTPTQPPKWDSSQLITVSAHSIAYCEKDYSTMGALLVLAYLIGGVIGFVAGTFLCFLGYIYYVRHSYSHLPSPMLRKSLKG